MNSIWMRALTIALVAATGCSRDEIDAHEFLGKWEAWSRNHRSISGDMIVERGRITFSRKGEVAFDVLSFDGREYILRLSRTVDHGRIMRIGPISTSANRTEMEVAYYENVRDTAKARQHRHSGSVSWGVYVR